MLSLVKKEHAMETATNVSLVSTNTVEGTVVSPTLIPERFISITKVSDFPVVSEEYNSISAPRMTTNFQMITNVYEKQGR